MTLISKRRRSAARAGLALSVAAIAMWGTSLVRAQAQDAVQRLKEQGFARIAIANEPP
jgi:polar amino acid transport system substrate-binding protein